MYLREQQVDRLHFTWHLRAAGIVYGDVYGHIPGALEHLLGPSEVGRDDVDPEEGAPERGVAPAAADVGHCQPGRRRVETEVRVTVGGVVTEDLDEDLHRKARYEGACVLPSAELRDSSLGLCELLV